jgi:SAM-dependent methyltransferase
MSIEDGVVAARLRSFLERTASQKVHKCADHLIGTAGFEDRFHYFLPFVPEDFRRSILVSGSAIGTEMLVARSCGFEYACGIEVEPELAALAPVHLEGVSGCDSVLGDGLLLPFPDASFDVVASGHVIEHTANPIAYLDEHLRVLRPGGVFFLEFPDRNHAIELHTTAPGFEWMPGALRELTCLYLSSACPEVSEDHARAYSLILGTLNPIGMRDVLRAIKSSPYPAVLRHYYKPLPGFVRSVIVRQSADSYARESRQGRRALTGTFFDVTEEPLHWPKTELRRKQTELLLEQGLVAEVGRRVAQVLVFLLWCCGRFFALGSQVPEGLHRQLETVIPGYLEGWDRELIAVEDNLIPSLYSGLIGAIPELDGPYWPAILAAAFQDDNLRRALARYYSCWSEKGDDEFLRRTEFSDWPKAPGRSGARTIGALFRRLRR